MVSKISCAVDIILFLYAEFYKYILLHNYKFDVIQMNSRKI